MHGIIGDGSCWTLYLYYIHDADIANQRDSLFDFCTFAFGATWGALIFIEISFKYTLPLYFSTKEEKTEEALYIVIHSEFRTTLTMCLEFCI